jgi:uncharacterized protein YodC (DUF2158 family)
MKKPRFQKGEVVRLNSGGPDMTVREEKKGVVVCDWSEGNKTRRESYYSEQLSPAATELSDIERARRIAFILRQAVQQKDAPPQTLDGLIDAVLKEGPPKNGG